MELLQLKYFAHAAQTENFSKTAHFFGVPASAVSITIKRLENELNTKLFIRNKNKLSLSENGKSFAKEITLALSHISSAAGALSNEKNSGEIRLLALSDRRIITEKISEFKAMYPHITFLIEHTAPKEGYESFDLVIGEDTPHSQGFFKTDYISERIFLALSASNPLSKKNKIYLSDLKNQQFITMPEGSLFRITTLACQGAGFDPHIVIKCDDPYYLRKYVDMDLGIAFVPELSWQGQYGENTVLKKISDFSYIRKIFIYENPKNINPAAAKFKNFLLQ